MSELAKEYFTVKEAAARLRVCEKSIRRYLTDKTKIGGRIVISDKQLAEMLDKSKEVAR